MICSSQRSPSPASNHMGSNSSSNNGGGGGGQGPGVVSGAMPPGSVSAGTAPGRATCSFTPTLAAHFNENLIKHVQGWPAEHVEKQVWERKSVRGVLILAGHQKTFQLNLHLRFGFPDYVHDHSKSFIVCVKCRAATTNR